MYMNCLSVCLITSNGCVYSLRELSASCLYVRPLRLLLDLVIVPRFRKSLFILLWSFSYLEPVYVRFLLSSMDYCIAYK